MTKIQEIGVTEPGVVAERIERDTDFLLGARRTGDSPETFEDVQYPADILDRGTIYDFGMSIGGTPAGPFARRVVVSVDIKIEDLFARSYGWVTVPPDNDFVILMQVEGLGSPADLVTVATITIDNTGAYVFAAAPSPADIFIEAGSRVWFIYEAGGTSPPTPDPSITDIDFTIGARFA